MDVINKHILHINFLGDPKKIKSYDEINNEDINVVRFDKLQDNIRGLLLGYQIEDDSVYSAIQFSMVFVVDISDAKDKKEDEIKAFVYPLFRDEYLRILKMLENME